MRLACAGVSHFRRPAHLALALLLSLFAIAPHQHEGLTENVFRETVTPVNHCDAENPRHFDAAKAAHPSPCVACVRNHSAGAFRTTLVGFTQFSTIDRPSIVIAAPATYSRDFTPLRGPPAA
jgi:hypothetical protein